MTMLKIAINRSVLKFAKETMLFFKYTNYLKFSLHSVVIVCHTCVYLCTVNGENVFFILCIICQQAMMLLGNREAQSSAEREKIKAALLPLYLNLSLTELRLDSPHKALKYGNKALEIDSANTKALFRCGQVSQGFCLFFSNRDSHRV